MNSEKCDLCGTNITKYNTKYVKLQLIQNCQSQGMPDVFPKETLEYCVECTNKLFGDMQFFKEKL